MKTQEITDKKIWENFVTSQEDYTFLQSWSWGEFQKSQGEKVWRVGMYGKQLIGFVRSLRFLQNGENFCSFLTDH